MVILILFAFLAGIVTILSPCILPILPIILSGSVAGGKRRPLGIITGFIFSFTFFTLFLATIVKATNIPADALRTLSVVIVGLFGISLLVPGFQKLSEQLFSKLAQLTPRANNNSGFVGGLLIGLSLGLVWTPCVGPIIASVITLAATSSVNSAAIFMTIAYSIGTAIPMLGIIYGGRTLLQKVPFLTQKSGSIQKAFGVFMILTALAIHFNIDRKFQALVLDTFPQYGVGLTQIEDNEAVRQELDKLQNRPTIEKQIEQSNEDLKNQTFPIAPEIIPGGEWINSEPLTLTQLRGKVVMIDFWTYTCINCIRTLPYLRSWHEKYADKGLVIIGVHTPEFEFEKSLANVQKATDDFKLRYPIMQDNDYATWRAYSNRYWPAKYLIDKNGRVRDYHFGEGKYDETEKMIQKLLGETGQDLTNIEIQNPDYDVNTQTPETYLGYARIDNFVSRERIVQNQKQVYTLPERLGKNEFGYRGEWLIGEEYARPSAGASLRFNFDATEVFLVMRPAETGTQGKVRLLLDDKPLASGQQGEDVTIGQITIDSDRLYKLIKLPRRENHSLTIEFEDENIEVYAFTFG